MRHFTFRHAIPVALIIAAAACSDTAKMTDMCNIKIVDITPPSASLHVGNTVTLQAAYTGTGPCIPTTPVTSLRWSSSAPAIVTIDAVTGTVTAVAAGSAEIGIHLPDKTINLGGATITVTSP